MVFKRRDPAPIWSRLTEAFSPRKGWRRGFEYLSQRVRRLPDSPHRIALGVALGTFVSFSPLYTLHIPLTLLLAWIVRGNLIAGFAGTFVGNALTTPFIAVGAVATGNFVIGRDHAGGSFTAIAQAFGEAFSGLWQIALSVFGMAEAQPERLLPFLNEVFLPYLIGGAMTGLLAAAATYYLCRPVVAAYQARRRAKLVERARQRVHEGMSRVAARSEPAE